MNVVSRFTGSREFAWVRAVSNRCWDRLEGTSRTLALYCLWTLAAAVFARSAEPPGYYASASGLTGQALRHALHAIAKAGQNVVPYDSSSVIDTVDGLRVLDEDAQDTNAVILLYAERSEAKTIYPTIWNWEHLWPESYGTAAGPAHSDLFNLRPEDSRVNSARGDKYYDDSDPKDRLYRNPAHANAPLCSTDSDSWEPPSNVKGDIARAMFYMDLRYEGDAGEPDLVLTDSVAQVASGNLFMGKLRTLLRWHRGDPVGDSERERNDLVYEQFQRNRNPFVDHPEWVEAIFLPQLLIRREGDGVIVSWEPRWSRAVLEVAAVSAGAATNSINWTTDDQIPRSTVDAFILNVTSASEGRLYRLRVP